MSRIVDTYSALTIGHDKKEAPAKQVLLFVAVYCLVCWLMIRSMS